MAPTDVDRRTHSLARACRLNYLEFCRELARWSGTEGTVIERDGVLLWATASTFPVSLNGVARLDPAAPPDVVLGLGHEWFGERGRGFTVNAEEGPDDDLRAAAEADGFHVLRDSPQMVCTTPMDAPRPGPGVTLRWVDDATGFEQFVEIVDTAYQSLGAPAGAIRDSVVDTARMSEPHVDAVLAELDGVAVATAQLVLSHGIGGVYYVGTLEQARGRGLGELVSRAVTARGFERGATAVGLQASPMGEPIYRRMGFHDLYRQRGLAHIPGF